VARLELHILGVGNVKGFNKHNRVSGLPMNGHPFAQHYLLGAVKGFTLLRCFSKSGIEPNSL